MNNSAIFTFTCIWCILSITSLADEAAPKRIHELPTGAEASQLITEKYRNHLIPQRGPKSLLRVQKHFLHGKADDLNRFLADTAKLPQTFDVTVYFTGPNGLNVAVPLTEDAAQAGVNYDWSVQLLPNNKVNIVIPLAARIPFAVIDVPSHLVVETDLGAPEAAEQFARIHNANNSARHSK